ncbi:integrase/recombinase xerD homolog [Podarcis muralis]
MIHNLSYPKGGSVNDAIPQELCTVRYATFDQAVQLIRKFGKGALLAKCDIESAFRLLPVHPEDFRWLGFKFDGAYFVDKAMPMGCSVACAAFEAFSTFLDWALRFKTGAEGVSHYLDDFILVEDSRPKCAELLEAFTSLAGELGVPLAADKTEGPATTMVYLDCGCFISLSDGPLPLVGTGCRAAASAIPGTSVEARGPEAWGPESWEPEVIQGVMASVAPSTLRSYKKAWSDFLKFRNKTCAIRNNAPPVKPEVLAYLVYLRRLGRAPRTLNLQAAAISFFCKAVFSTDPCDDFVIRRTLEGWRRLQPPSHDMGRPITFDILSQIHKRLRTVCWSRYEARLFSAAYSIAFFGALRVGELVYEAGQHGFSRGLLLSDVTLSREDLVVRIRSSKTDQYGRGALVQLMATDSPGPCPVKDTRRFLSMRVNSAGPLLIHADGLPLTRHQFTRVMRLALAACGIPAADFASHSFRIGAATTAMHLGLTAERIRDVGRWKSDAYKRYLRKNL